MGYQQQIFKKFFPNVSAGILVSSRSIQQTRGLPATFLCLKTQPNLWQSQWGELDFYINSYVQKIHAFTSSDASPCFEYSP